ncbi:hypothetical protein [Shimia sp. SDUM112013]
MGLLLCCGVWPLEMADILRARQMEFGGLEIFRMAFGVVRRIT